MQQAIGRGLLQNQMNFDPGWEDELNDWLNKEHMYELVQAPGIFSARRFVLATDPAWGDAEVCGRHQFMTHYQLADAGVLESAGYLAHRRHGGTAWTKRIIGKYRVQRASISRSSPATGR